MKTAEFREQKAEQKAARLEVEKLFTAIVRARQPWLKGAKLRQAVKLMTDRYYTEVIRPAAQKIEAALTAEAQKRACSNVSAG